MDGLQSPQIDAILKALKDDKIWDVMVMCDGKNKNMLGGGPAPGVGLQNMPRVDPAPGVGLPNMPGVGPAPGVGVPIMVGVGPVPALGIPTPERVSSDDPQAIKVAKWAVAEKKRKYVSLFTGLKWKLVVGTVYAILIINRDDKQEYTSGATVMELSTTGAKKLTVWKDINGAQD